MIKKMSMLLACCLLLLLTGAKPDAGTSPSLLRNGDLRQPDPADTNKPAFWDKPDGLGVRWIDAPSDADGTGRAIQMDTSVSEKAMVAQWKKMGIEKWDIPGAGGGPVAATYGLSFYSDAMPVQTGQAYRITFKFKGSSGGGKVWVRGYGTFRGKERRLYDTIVNCRVQGKDWTAFSQAFHPTANTPDVTSIRVMLYAYWPPGLYEFRNIAIVPISQSDWEAEMKESEE